MSPQRIQRKREKGWRMPAGAIYVGRPSRWGNPFRAYKCSCCGYWDVKDDNGATYMIRHEQTRRPEVRADRTSWTSEREAAAHAVWLFSEEAHEWLGGGRMSWDAEFAASVRALAGHDLACWCPLDMPCHADVLLDLAAEAES